MKWFSWIRLGCSVLCRLVCVMVWVSSIGWCGSFSRCCS